VISNADVSVSCADCAIDPDSEKAFKIPSVIPVASVASADVKAGNPAMKDKFDAQLAAVAGMKLKSKCMKMKVLPPKERGVTDAVLETFKDKAQCRAPNDPSRVPVHFFIDYLATQDATETTKKMSTAGACTKWPPPSYPPRNYCFLPLPPSPLLPSPPSVNILPGPGLLSPPLNHDGRTCAGNTADVDGWYTGSMESKAQFCGRLYDHALQTSAFYDQAEGTAGAKPYTKDNVEDLLTGKLNTPAICTKAVMVKDTKDKISPECKTGTKAEFKLGDGSTEPTFTFVSPAIAWTGICEDGQCLVCQESANDKRCNGGYGIRQQCIVAVDYLTGEAQAEWVRDRGLKVTTVLPDLMQTFHLAGALFGLVFIIMLLQCFSGFSLMKMSRSRTAADTAGFKVVSVPSPA
jgi:hypothetical protein